MRFFLLLFLAFIFPNFANAAPIVRAELVSEQTAIEAGENLRLSLFLHHPEGWHSYTKDPGDAGLPTTLSWNLTAGFSASEIDWPPAEKITEGSLTVYGYTGDILLPVTITTPANLSEPSYKFSAKAQWLVCKDICIPEEQEVEIVLPVYNANNDTSNQQPAASNSSWFFALIVALTFAILGGLVLNLMPCVLPVLSLKALALVKKSGRTREHTARHGVAYTLGVLVSFAVLATILISLQKAGQAIGWGYQMQFPAFVGFLIYLLFAVGLSLSGAFHLPVLLGGAGGIFANENSVRGSFFTGILAAMVATPCTAPFMASAVGAALTLPAWAALLVFLALGFGLALPFLLISIFPSTLRFLPKQGAWMVRFKEFLAFPIYGSVIWLLWVLGLQAGMGAVAIVLAGMLFLAFVLWLTRWHFLVLLLAGSVMVATLMSISETSDNELKNQEISYENPYSKTALSKLRAEGKAVYIDATAAWCITCQLNKRVVLENANVQAAFAKNNVTLMVADWTRKNPEVTEFLHEFGYDGVPLNVFYPADGDPIILPQLLSEKTVIDAITR